ncbi:hypothetical protein [Nostoc sp. FACHB-280]|uniref:hypothetical protein n=1 Tax=Nostoc sp. FACHB-280 TaxID=2692839 RepID=UPI00168A8CAE|nr:hypothetical protein [Nostoc sp. FACHB-280]MBD2498920.1 hypothetical protein [Nostoc sp. FACHB-280]
MNNLSRKRKKSTSVQSAEDISSVNSQKQILDSEYPATATIEITTVEVPELTPEEQSDRLHLERRVERAFFEAGKALMELRDRRLYRSTHRTFEEYCKDRFSYTYRHVNYLIAGSVIVDNIKMGTNSSQNEQAEEMGTISSQILPTSEVQVRPLAKLEPQQQQEAWQTAVQEAKGKVPSGRIVKDVVQRIMESTQVPNSYQIGEVCQILVKDNPDLRGKGGCWGLVTHVGEFSCTVKTWDCKLTVGVQYLKSFNYQPDECQQMQQICERINRVYSSELEESVQRFLESLGKLRRAYLTQLEEKLLSLLELEMSN